MLVLERTRPVGRTELAALLWGDDPPASWESVLRTAVARVRSALREAGLDGRTTIWAASGHYRLTLPERTVVDVEEVAVTIEHARVALAAGRPEEAVDALDGAVAVTRLPFLPDLDGDWVRKHRTRLRASRLHALEVLGEARLAAGLPVAAVAAAREVVDLDPFRESSHRLLMSVLAGSGNRAKALLAYERCRRLLADELGVDPSPETEAMYRELLGAERTAWVSGPVGLPAGLRAAGDGVLVGRARELAVFRGLDLISSGPPRVVLVSGEAGAGKTALVAHAARAAAAAGALVLYGRCAEARKLVYRPFVEVLTQLAGHVPAVVVADLVTTYGTGLLRLVPELGRGAEPEPGADRQTERHLLFRAVATLLTRAATGRPVLVVVDDLHCADQLSLLLLRYLAAAVDPSRLVLVVAYRDAAGEDVTNTVHELRRLPSATRMALAGLSVTDLVPLVEEVAGQRLGAAAAVWARAVWRDSGGNPFFAKELLAHLARRFAVRPASGWTLPGPGEHANLGLPDTVCDGAADRVAGLGDRGADVLAHAAVAGPDFDLAMLEPAAEDEVLAALDRAVAAGLLVELPGDTGYFAFRHPLVQRAVYARLGVTRRRRLHRRVAIALEHSNPARLGELARHWLLGHERGERRHAAAWACRAGADALAHLAPEQALRWFREAFACLGGRPGGDALHIDILIGLGEAQRGIGDQDHRETLLTAGRFAEAAGDTARLVRAAVANNRGSVSCGGRLDTERVALLEAAIDAARDHPQRPLLDAVLAVELLATSDADRRARLADDAVRGAREHGDPELLGRVLALRFEATWTPATQRRRLADSAELVDLAAASPDQRLRLCAARLRAFACWESGRIVESDEQLAAECRIADVLSEPYLRWIAALDRAGRLLAASRLAVAETAVREALRRGSAAGEPDAMLAYGVQLFNLRRQQGRADELLPVLLGTADFANYDIRPAIALIHADRGAPERARAIVGDLLDRPLSPPVSQAQAGGCWLLAELAGTLGDAEAAGRLYDLLRGWRRLFLVNQVVREGPVERHLGVLAATTGDLTRAVGHLTSAMRAADAVPMPYWAAETRVALARTLLRRGGPTDHERAGDLLERADEAARRFGFAGLRRAMAAGAVT